MCDDNPSRGNFRLKKPDTIKIEKSIRREQNTMSNRHKIGNFVRHIKPNKTDIGF